MKFLKVMFVTRKKGAGMVNLSWVLMQFIDCFLYLFLAHSIFGDKVSGNKKICVIFIYDVTYTFYSKINNDFFNYMYCYGYSTIFGVIIVSL